MERCYVCGVKLLAQARFCSNCGAICEDTAYANEQTQISRSHLEHIPPTLNPEATFIQDTQILPPSPMLSPGTDMDERTESADGASEEEKKGVALADLGLLVPLVDSSLTPMPHIPVIQGAPQIGSIPVLPATPQAGPLAGNAPPPPSYGSQLQHGLHHSTSQIPHAARHVVHATAGKTAGGLAVKWVVVIIISTILVAGGAIGGLAYILTRPQPAISVSSSYTVGKIPAGSDGTRMHIAGTHFSDNSAITLLLDGSRVSGAPHISSDSKGNMSANLPITSAWPMGRHTLAARDAGGYSTKVGIVIEIVPPGEASTPGPLGAPPDDASFKVKATFQGQYDQGGGPFTWTDTETVTGHADPKGGSACQSEDDGQPHQYSSQTLDTGIPETQTVTYSCLGTYKAGTLKLTETLLSDTIQLTDDGAPITCQLLTPGVSEQLVGSYTAQSAFSGTITITMFPRQDFSCTTGPFSSFYFFLYGGNGTWTGTVSNS